MAMESRFGDRLAAAFAAEGLTTLGSVAFAWTRGEAVQRWAEKAGLPADVCLAAPDLWAEARLAARQGTETQAVRIAESLLKRPRAPPSSAPEVERRGGVTTQGKIPRCTSAAAHSSANWTADSRPQKTDSREEKLLEEVYALYMGARPPRKPVD